MNKTNTGEQNINQRKKQFFCQNCLKDITKLCTNAKKIGKKFWKSLRSRKVFSSSKLIRARN